MRIVAPLAHSEAINGGAFLSVNVDGEIDWQRAKHRQLVGSHDARLQVWTDGPGLIGFEGSPAKWFQGHNVFGTDDLIGLACETLNSICDALGLTSTAAERALWAAGGFQVRRADITYSRSLRDRSDVLAWIRAAEQSATMAHRGRGTLTKGGTLYFGKHSRRWSFKAYSKGQEIHAAGHTLPAHVAGSSIPSHAESLLRFELVLRSMELKRLGLDQGIAWKDETAAEQHAEKMKGLQMPEHIELPTDELEALPARLRAAYELHQKGMDTRQIYSRRTWYRHRRELLQHGIDLSANIGNEDAHANVVPFVRRLIAEPVDHVPPWAVGTPLYFEPRVRFG